MSKLFQYWFPFNNHPSAIGYVGIAFAWAGLIVVLVAVGVGIAMVVL